MNWIFGDNNTERATNDNSKNKEEDKSFVNIENDTSHTAQKNAKVSVQSEHDIEHLLDKHKTNVNQLATTITTTGVINQKMVNDINDNINSIVNNDQDTEPDVIGTNSIDNISAEDDSVENDSIENNSVKLSTKKTIPVNSINMHTYKENFSPECQYTGTKSNVFPHYNGHYNNDVEIPSFKNSYDSYILNKNKSDEEKYSFGNRNMGHAQVESTDKTKKHCYEDGNTDRISKGSLNSKKKLNIKNEYVYPNVLCMKNALLSIQTKINNHIKLYQNHEEKLKKNTHTNTIYNNISKARNESQPCKYKAYDLLEKSNCQVECSRISERIMSHGIFSSVVYEGYFSDIVTIFYNMGFTVIPGEPRANSSTRYITIYSSSKYI